MSAKRSQSGGYSQKFIPVTKRLTDQEMAFLLRTLRSSTKCGFDLRTFKGRRDHALLHLLVGTGCRIAEIAKGRERGRTMRSRELRLGDLEQVTIAGKPAFRITFTGKGGRRRINIITNGTVDVLRNYLDRRPGPDDDDAPVFWSVPTRGRRKWYAKPMTTDAAYAVVKSLGERLGLDLHPHRFRHTLASRMAEKGMTAFQLADWMGWSQIQMAQRYVELSDRSLEEMAATVWSAGA